MTDRTNVATTRDGSSVRVGVDGGIDMATVHHLEEHLDTAARFMSPREIVVDLSGCTYLDSSGLKLLAERCTDDGGPHVRLGDLSGPALRVIEVSGLAGLLLDEPRRVDASRTRSTA